MHGPMRCLPHRTSGLIGLLLAFLLLVVGVGRASAMDAPAVLRHDPVPGIPADATASEQPNDILPALLRQSVEAGVVRFAVRDFTSGGVTIGREIIATFDQPDLGDGMFDGMSADLGAPSVETEAYRIWRGHTSADGTRAMNVISVKSEHAATFVVVAATLPLSDEQLLQVADAYGAELGVTSTGAATAATGSSGSPVVNILVILIAIGLVSWTVRSTRRRAAAPAAPPAHPETPASPA